MYDVDKKNEEMNKDYSFKSTFEYKLIYVFAINDEAHKGCLKVGDATLKTDKLYTAFVPSCSELNTAAKNRIDNYTLTAGIKYELLYTHIAVFERQGKVKAFRDYNVHKVLKNSGIKIKCFDTERKQNEWFITDLETIKNAIKAVIDNKSSLSPSQISNDKTPIIFRPEQKKAIKATLERFKRDHEMLWNAKMRFGKTLTALQVAKEMKFKRTIIITHRPVVKSSWREDFVKIFYDRNDIRYVDKDSVDDIADDNIDKYCVNKFRKGSLKKLIKDDENFVYFASIQDLRGSVQVGGTFNKNDEIFNTLWDFVIIDEAHEGTQTELGQNVLQSLNKQTSKHTTYILKLSGTPFNLLDEYALEQIYTWDYIMEQEAKANWDNITFGDSNPYEELPRMNIYTYDIPHTAPAYIDLTDKAFNFKEFFRTWTGDKIRDLQDMPAGKNIGDFVHEDDIMAFLDLICTKSDKTNYPFSTDVYRNYFRHSLWLIPGVREAKALSALLKEHKVFKNFEIINVAGDGDEEIDTNDAKTAVDKAIGDNPEQTYTITLSCGRLTTGVSVPAWTAVFMLAGSYSTSASSYLQTIFRVQTPANINGKIKEECYVFDFAPDRTLKMVAECVDVSSKAGSSNEGSKVRLGQFLNFCPVISVSESKMQEYSTNQLLQQLKRIHAERVANNGFDDYRLYNDELFKLTEGDLEDFANLKKIVGAAKQTKKSADIDINNQGFTDEEYEQLEKIKKKSKKELTEEERQELQKLKDKKAQRQNAISLLRAISIRIPLLVYGMDVDINTDISIDDFANNIDEESWIEFMPKGVTKGMFAKFIKYYDRDIFIAATRRIRLLIKMADEKEPCQRVQEIAKIFATFKNPDKETVLTPWRVVNMHIADTLGGWCFYDKEYRNTVEEPYLINQGDVTSKTLTNINAKILEINSKTGLYPLYATFSIYKTIIDKTNSNLDLDKKLEVWDSVVKNNIYIICKTEMAKKITYRTLLGFRKGSINAHHFDNIVNQFKEKQKQVIDKIKSKKFWNKGEAGEMEFDAVIGNPPYQEECENWQSTTNGQVSRKNVFHFFQIASDKITGQYTSLIYPGIRWIHRSGKGMEDFGKKQINDSALEKLILYEDANKIFTDVAIPDGISIVLKNNNKKSDIFEYVFHTKDKIYSQNLNSPGDDLMLINPKNTQLVEKVNIFVSKNNCSFMFDRILPRNLFGIESDYVELNPEKVQIFDNGKKYDWNKYVKLYTNDRAGKAGRTKWFVTEKTNISQNQELISQWQVVVSSANAGGQKRDNQIEIIDNHSAFGRSRVALGTFKTQKEAENFYNYSKTYLIRFMYLMTDENLTSLGKCVPDILNYTDNSKYLDFNSDLDSQLFSLFEISPQEQYYIKHVIDAK